MLLLIGLAATPLLGVLLWRHPTARLATVLVGALLVFQAPGTQVKVAYGLLAAVCVAVSLLRLAEDEWAAVGWFRATVAWAFLWTGVVALSLVVAFGAGTPAGLWFRDALPYVLLALLPIVGIEAGRGLSERSLDRLIGSVGCAAALALALYWLNRRGVFESSVERLLLPTSILCTLAFAYAVVRAGLAARPMRWTLVCVVTASGLILAGSRTNIIVMLAIVVAVVGPRSRARIPAPRLLRMLVAVTAMTLLATFVVAQWLDVGTYLSDRFSSMAAVISEGRQTLTSDLSFTYRSAQYEASQRQWLENFWFGGGPGHLYTSISVLFGEAAVADARDLGVYGTFSLDSPWLVLAKFGLLGTAALVAYLVAFFGALRRAHAVVGDSFVFTVARAFVVALVIRTPFGPWPEDKGTALSFVLLAAVTASASAAATPSDSRSATRSRSGSRSARSSDRSPSSRSRAPLR